jgi:uncharacterized protein (TIGR03086 family)
MLDAVRATLDRADRVIVGIAGDRRHLSTPCEDYDVERLTAHLVQKVVYFGGLPSDGPTDPAAVPEPDLHDVPLAEPFRAAADRVRSSWRPEHLEGTYDLEQGPLSGTELARYFLLELLGHGWDLAVATGQPADLGDALAEEGLRAARAIGEATLRSPGLMGPAVPPPDSTATDRFAAYIGRNPRAWRRG